MGLGISVGILADLTVHDPEGADWVREKLAIINRYLSEQGLPEHREPEKLPPLHCRAELMSFPYSFLHYLRRVYARAKQDPDWIAVPVPEGEDPSRDRAVDEETFMFDSHLLCHSDCEGYYLPLDFDELITGDDVPGGFAGSSHRLLEELHLAARPLGIALEEGELSDQEAARINGLVEEDGPLHREYAAWLALFEAARLSIAHNCVIKFG
jgi:hypothetical protein